MFLLNVRSHGDVGLGQQLPGTEVMPPVPLIFKTLSDMGWVFLQKLLTSVVGARELNTHGGLSMSQTVPPPFPA